MASVGRDEYDVDEDGHKDDVTLWLSRNRSVGKSKVIRLLSIIHNGIILDLVCGFGGSVGEDVRADFSQ